MLSATMRTDLARLCCLEARDARLSGNHSEALRLAAIGLAVERGAYAHAINEPPPPPPPIPWGPLPPPPTTPAPCGPCKRNGSA